MIERTARVLAAVVLALFALVGAVMSTMPTVPVVVAAATAVTIGALLSALRTTGWPLVVGAVAVGAAFTVIGNDQNGNLGWFGICLLAGWVALTTGTAGTVVFGVVATAGFVVQWTLVGNDDGWGPWISGTLFSLVACLMAGQQRVMLEQLRAAQAGLADRARAEERTRIAREMHDVIGHALTVTLLHIGSARLALDDEPDRARDSLEEAELHARRSLEDLRASVGLLRGPVEGTAPLPGVADLDDLVESFRLTGAPVACEVVGDITRLPAAVGLAAYRIVQEALTNSARHAPGATTDVRVDVEGELTIVVDSSGGPAPRTSRTENGAGLRGMRERAEAVGGVCDAGPTGHGWRVRAVLPT